MRGSSNRFMTINSKLEHYDCSTKTPVLLNDDNLNTSNGNNLGSSCQISFAYEFGILAMSSFESMTPTIKKYQYGEHAIVSLLIST